MDWLTVLTCSTTVIASVLLAAIPWAYSIHGRLSHIEALLSETRMTVMDDVERNTVEIRDLWKQIAEVKERIAKVEKT